MFGAKRQLLRRAAPMSVFHVPPMSASDHQRASGALARLREHVDGFRTRALGDEVFERVERELHERFVEAEREVLGELLERFDVDVPSVEIGDRRYHRVLKHRELYDGGGAGEGQAHAVSVRARALGGTDGASGGNCRGALERAGGTSGELCGGADDAQGATARVGQHGAVEKRSGPPAQGAECALGGKPRGVRVDVARGLDGAR